MDWNFKSSQKHDKIMSSFTKNINCLLFRDCSLKNSDFVSAIDKLSNAEKS